MIRTRNATCYPLLLSWTPSCLDGCCTYQVVTFLENGQRLGYSPKEYFDILSTLGSSLERRDLVFIDVSKYLTPPTGGWVRTKKLFSEKCPKISTLIVSEKHYVALISSSLHKLNNIFQLLYQKSIKKIYVIDSHVTFRQQNWNKMDLNPFFSPKLNAL